MKSTSHGKGTVRFILSQLGASALVLAVLFMIPISALLEDQVREGEAAGAIATETQSLQDMARLAQVVAQGGGDAADIVNLRGMARVVRGMEPRLAEGLPEATQRALDIDITRYADTAGRLTGDGSDAPAYRDLVDIQGDLLQRLATSERVHVERTHAQSQRVYVMVGCALAALLLLLASGWRSLLRASSEGRLLRERVAQAEADDGDAQVARMEELYLIVASAGVDSARQVERALAYAQTSLGYEWALAIEWLDDEEPAVTASLGPDAASSGDHALGFDLEKAIVMESSRAGEPVTFRIDRLPPALAPLVGTGRVLPWRHCVAYTFPGDFRERTPHCGLFLATRKPRSEGVALADQQLIRLIGTLVSSASRSARHQKRLDSLAFNDPLTGMPNRELLRHQLEETIQREQADGGRFAVHYIDLDGFKRVNDEDGHEIGDEVLKIAALRMGKVLRPGETLARFGGDEFVVLQTRAENRQDAREVAERLIDQLSRPFAILGKKHRIGASIGIAMFPADGSTPTELLRHADSALYASKRNGKGRATFYVAPAMLGAAADDVVA